MSTYKRIPDQLTTPPTPKKLSWSTHSKCFNLNFAYTFLIKIIFNDAAMIRLPPTLIALGQSDLRDFDKRSRQKTVEAYFDRLSINSSNTQGSEMVHELKGVTIRRQPSPRKKQTMASSPKKSKMPKSPESFVNLASPPPSPKKGEKASSDEHGYVSVERNISPENEDSQSTPRSPVKEDDFHYGGFIESPGNSTSSHRSSPFGKSHEERRLYVC